MKNQKRALKITTIIVLTFFMLMFLVFLLTFDLTDSKKYRLTKTQDEVSTILVDYLNDALKKSSIINVIDVDIDDDFIDNAFYLLLDGDKVDDDIYKTRNYVIKGYDFETDNNRIFLNLYITYQNLIKYDFRIRIRLDFIETDTSFQFSLKTIKIGNLIVPSLIVEKTLKNRESTSLGSAISGLLNSLPIGSYSQDTMTYTISKRDLVDEIRRGATGKSLFSENKILSSFSGTLISTLFSFDYINFEFADVSRITVDYSRLVNLKRETDPVNKSKVRSIKYDILLKEFLGNESINLSKEDVRKCLMYQIFIDYPNNYEGFIEFDNIDYKISDSELILSLSYGVFSKESTNDYIFRRNNDIFILERIEVGRDENENENDYLIVNKTDSENDFLSILSDIKIDTNIINQTISLDSFISPLNIKDYSVKYQDGFTIVFNMNEDILNTIKNTIFKDDFKNTLSLSLKDNLNFDSTEQLIESFSNLSYQLKESFFLSLKDYLKTSSLVYNYINEIY